MNAGRLPSYRSKVTLPGHEVHNLGPLPVAKANGVAPKNWQTRLRYPKISQSRPLAQDMADSGDRGVSMGFAWKRFESIEIWVGPSSEC